MPSKFYGIPGLSTDGYDVVIERGRLDVVGRVYSPGGTSVRVHLRDNSGKVLLASGTSVPSAEAGYAKGATFLKTDASTGVSGKYENTGTTSSCVFSQILQGSLPVTSVQYASVSLTNAEIKALRASPKTLVAAPGSGLLLQFISVVLELVAGANVLSESTANLVVRYTDGSGAIVSQTIEATGFIDQAANTITVGLAKIDPIAAASACLNKALVLHNTGAGEYGGNAANDATLVAKVVYRTLDFS